MDAALGKAYPLCRREGRRAEVWRSEQLRQEFDSVVAHGCNAQGLGWPEGPHVSVEGVFRGREVYLQVLAYAPEDEEPGLKLDATRRRQRTQ